MDRAQVDHIERIREASRHADLLARTLRDAICSPDLCMDPYRDRLRWWAYVSDDVSEDLMRLEREVWQ